MIEVLLMGTTPLVNDGEGEMKAIPIGRYAALVELSMALGEVDVTEKADPRLKGFIGGIEARLGTALAAQVCTPAGYMRKTAYRAGNYYKIAQHMLRPDLQPLLPPEIDHEIR